MDIRRKNGKSGMTLIEILVVVALLGILAGVLVRSVSGSMNAGKMATAKLFCDTTVKSAVESCKVSNGNQLPTVEMVKKFLGNDLKDPGNHEYGFQVAKDKSAAVDVLYVWSKFGAANEDTPPAKYDASGATPAERVAAIKDYNDKAEGYMMYYL